MPAWSERGVSDMRKCVYLSDIRPEAVALLLRYLLTRTALRNLRPESGTDTVRPFLLQDGRATRAHAVIDLPDRCDLCPEAETAYFTEALTLTEQIAPC
jgi:hypothetical protein